MRTFILFYPEFHPPFVEKRDLRRLSPCASRTSLPYLLVRPTRQQVLRPPPWFGALLNGTSILITDRLNEGGYHWWSRVWERCNED